MQESLVNILTRLESEVKELKAKVLTLENKKAISFDEDIKELKTKVLTLENKKSLPFDEDIKELKTKVLTLENKKAISFDIKSDVKSIVTVDFITALYKDNK